MSFFVEDLLANTNMEMTVREIHNLAYFYHWSMNECWHCPCTLRGVFNDQIKQQLNAESKAANNSGSTTPKPYKESRRY